MRKMTMIDFFGTVFRCADFFVISSCNAERYIVK